MIRRVTVDAEPGAVPAPNVLRRVVTFFTRLLFGDKEMISGAVYGTIITWR